MDGPDPWRRLLEALDAWGVVREDAPGRIRVGLPDRDTGRHTGSHPPEVVILMTAEQWAEMAGTMWGDLDDAIADVERTLRALRPDQGYAVYADYRLEPSTGPTLPEPAGPQPEPGGQWVALDPRGNVTGRFADRADEEDPGGPAQG